MNELSKFLADSIIQEENSVDNKVVVYSGRFQPFHNGHYSTYTHLIKKFGKDNVYIGTSNKTDNNKSPFNFKEKEMIINTMFGIPRDKIVKIKNLYVPTEILQKFDEDSTAFITVVGKKDANRLGGKFFSPYKDNIDFESYKDRGYVYVAPNQPNPISGTEVRNKFKSGSIEDKKDFFANRAYPKFNKKIFDFISNSLSETIQIPKRVIEQWVVEHAEAIEEVTTTIGPTDADDGPNYIYPDFGVFKKVSQQRAELIGYTVLSQIMGDELTDIDNNPIYPTGPPKSVSSYPAGAKGETTTTNQRDLYDEEAYYSWFNHIKGVINILGYSIIDYAALDDTRKDSIRYLAKDTDLADGGLDESLNRRLDEIPMDDLERVDHYADRQFNPLNVVLTGRHFYDRLKDPRNKKPISVRELVDFFGRLGSQKKKFVKFLNKYGQIVAKDKRSNLNIPFMRKANKIIAKTIMRKRNFRTSNAQYKFENIFHPKSENILREDTVKNISKSLGVARKNMPQIESKHVKDFIKYLKGKEVSVSPSSVRVSKVGMTQKEINFDKVKSMLTVDKKVLAKPVIISKDNYILDGHHRVAALYNLDKSSKLKTLQVNLGIKDLLKVAKEFPKTTFKRVNETLLKEGGTYGHMNHPFDTDINLTFGQLKDIVNKALDGELELTREKTDGMALSISWKDGRLVAGRNKGHLKNKGENAMDINGVATKFSGRGEIEDAYNFAMKDLSNAIEKLTDNQRERIFKNGSCFMNLEVIYPTTSNVIPYDQSLLIFHGTMEYNEQGQAIGENQKAGKTLADMIEKVNENVQLKYTIQGPPITKLPKSKDLSKLKGRYNSKISKLQSQFNLRNDDGVGEYHQAFWVDFINKKSPTKLDNRTLMGLVNRWAFNNKSFRLNSKNIQDGKTLKWAKSVDKNDHKQIAKDNIKPFEDIFLGVGSEVLSLMSSVLAANPDKAVRTMKTNLDKTIKDVKKSGDERKIEKLRKELERLDSSGGRDGIVPNEGIVFQYPANGKVYTLKLTGNFASLNQILGIMYYDR